MKKKQTKNKAKDKNNNKKQYRVWETIFEEMLKTVFLGMGI